jgi:hypothetical protein
MQLGEERLDSDETIAFMKVMIVRLRRQAG